MSGLHCIFCHIATSFQGVFSFDKPATGNEFPIFRIVFKKQVTDLTANLHRIPVALASGLRGKAGPRIGYTVNSFSPVLPCETFRIHFSFNGKIDGNGNVNPQGFRCAALVISCPRYTPDQSSSSSWSSSVRMFVSSGVAKSFSSTTPITRPMQCALSSSEG